MSHKEVKIRPLPQINYPAITEISAQTIATYKLRPARFVNFLDLDYSVDYGAGWNNLSYCWEQLDFRLDLPEEVELRFLKTRKKYLETYIVYIFILNFAVLLERKSFDTVSRKCENYAKFIFSHNFHAFFEQGFDLHKN
jgi:hypothetical protein